MHSECTVSENTCGCWRQWGTARGGRNSRYLFFYHIYRSRGPLPSATPCQGLGCVPGTPADNACCHRTYSLAQSVHCRGESYKQLSKPPPGVHTCSWNQHPSSLQTDLYITNSASKDPPHQLCFHTRVTNNQKSDFRKEIVWCARSALILLEVSGGVLVVWGPSIDSQYFQKEKEHL